MAKLWWFYLFNLLNELTIVRLLHRIVIQIDKGILIVFLFCIQRTVNDKIEPLKLSSLILATNLFMQLCRSKTHCEMHYVFMVVILFNHMENIELLQICSLFDQKLFI